MISIVVPVLNEGGRLGAFLRGLEGQEGEREVIVADGGSRDGTPGAAAPPARLVHSPPGRARQMNAGAALARGEVLLFLHCDTQLPPGALALIREALRDPACVGGGFRHRFDRGGCFSRFISGSANTRSRLWRIFLGDQAIFVRRSVFERLGGYADLPLFEDWELCTRLKRAGGLALIRQPAVTSGRRIEAWGEWKCLRLWWGLSLLYALGVPAERLARFYGDVR
ncbi:MAG: TIGR04283 family arsenosugar biosynthesis glycosyltransferase [Nitrospinota bacterium]